MDNENNMSEVEKNAAQFAPQAVETDGADSEGEVVADEVGAPTEVSEESNNVESSNPKNEDGAIPSNEKEQPAALGDESVAAPELSTIGNDNQETTENQ